MSTIQSAPLRRRKGRASVGAQRLAAADQTPESPHAQARRSPKRVRARCQAAPSASSAAASPSVLSTTAAGSRYTATATNAAARARCSKLKASPPLHAPSSSAPPADPPRSASRAHRRCRVPAHDQSPRPRLIDAPAENRATARASAGIANTGHVESTAAPYLAHAPSASTHSTHRAGAVHNLAPGQACSPTSTCCPSAT